jgi:threonine/homoserine/homoserine lactone efflux protein
MKSWRSSAERLDIAAIKPQSGRAGFLGGLTITLGNPKVIIFLFKFFTNFRPSRATSDQ